MKELSKNDNELEIIQTKTFFLNFWFDGINELDLPITKLKREHFNNDLTLSQLTDLKWITIQRNQNENL